MQKRDKKKALITEIVAQKNKKSVRSVERYIKGDVDNDEVLADYDDLDRAVNTVINAYRENRLMRAVNELVPFK